MWWGGGGGQGLVQSKLELICDEYLHHNPQLLAHIVSSVERLDGHTCFVLVRSRCFCLSERTSTQSHHDTQDNATTARTPTHASTHSTTTRKQARIQRKWHAGNANSSQQQATSTHGTQRICTQRSCTRNTYNAKTRTMAQLTPRKWVINAPQSNTTQNINAAHQPISHDIA